VIERDVRRTRGLNEGRVGDFVPGVQRGLCVDIVGDGGTAPVVGKRIVVLPEVVDQIISERRDGGDRLSRAVGRTCRAGIHSCNRDKREVIVTVVGVYRLEFLHRADHLATNLQVNY
jgi:hypothetical protein